MQYLKRGSQSLREALSLALQCGEMASPTLHTNSHLRPTSYILQEVAAEAALKIVDSWGTHDARTTALHLAVYQAPITHTVKLFAV